MRIGLTFSTVVSALLFSIGLAGCGNGNGNSGGNDGGTMGCPAGQVKFDNLCVTQPTIEADRTQCGDVTEFCDKSGMKGPVLGCLTAGAKNHPADPRTVTLTGFVHPFSAGTSNSTVTVQIFKASDLMDGKDISSVTPIATKEFTFDPGKATDATQFRACDKDPKIGCVAVAPTACTPACSDGLPTGQLDGMGKPIDNQQYCRSLGNGKGMCSDRLRWERRFAIDNIPTNIPLVILGTGGGGMPSTNWNTLVQWNVFLASDDKSCGGDAQAVDCVDTSDAAHPKYQLNVNVISQADYGNIPTSAGLSGGISQNEGAVAGEIHDCDNVRVENVQVSVSPAGDRLTYFNGNPYSTVPDSSRAKTGTDRLGLFASLNIVPGKVVVEGVGLVGGKTVSLGKFNAFVYPGVVSVVNVNGGKPVQP